MRAHQYRQRLVQDRKLACPCGFDETNCLACSNFKLQRQQTISLDRRVNLNQNELSKISNTFFKTAKSTEERDVELLGGKKPVKYRSNTKTTRQRNRRDSKENSRRFRETLEEDEVKYLTMEEFSLCLNGLFDGFPMNVQIYRAFDTKRDGKIDYDEFSAACMTLVRVYGFNVFCTNEEVSKDPDR